MAIIARIQVSMTVRTTPMYIRVAQRQARLIAMPMTPLIAATVIRIAIRLFARGLSQRSGGMLFVLKREKGVTYRFTVGCITKKRVAKRIIF